MNDLWNPPDVYPEGGREIKRDDLEGFARRMTEQAFALGFDCGKARACRVIAENPEANMFQLLALIEKEQNEAR